MKKTGTLPFTAPQMETSSRSSATEECAIASTSTRASREPSSFPRNCGKYCPAVSAESHSRSNAKYASFTLLDNNATMGATYLRICDSRKNAHALILKETSSHGSNPITLSSPPCDPDGSYYSKQCDGSQCFCRT